MAARDDIKAAWEANNNFLDSTGNGYTLSNTSITFSSDAFLGSHAFSSAGTPANLINASADLETPERNFWGWFKPSAIGGDVKFLHQHRANETLQIGTLLLMNTNGTVRLLIGNGTWFVDLTSSTVLSTGNYKRVGFRSKAGSHQLIIGNTIEGTSSNANFVTYSGDFQIIGSTAGTRVFAGLADNIWLGDKWKPDADWTEHWNGGIGIEYDGIKVFHKLGRGLNRGIGRGL